MADEPKGAIVFGKEELSPTMKAEYQKRIANAKNAGVNALKGNEPPGGGPRPVIPDFAKIREAAQAARGEGVGGFPNSDGGVSPRPPGSPMISSNTEQQLKDLVEASKEGVKELPKAEEKKATSEEALFDILDFADQKSEAERLLNNKKRREEIEARCEPMKFEDLLYKNEVQQKIPILPGKFEPTLRSITPEESLFIKQYIAREQTVSDNYTLEKYNLCLLACSLVAINDSPLPDHRDLQGVPDQKMFEVKLKSILRKSGYIVSDLGVNYVWFDLRVRRLITADGLKNG